VKTALKWSPDAKEDIDRLFEFLLVKDPFAAERAVLAIRGSARKLLDFPEAGRPMDDDTDRRELFVPFGAGAYVLRYRLSNDDVIVIRVWHSRETR